NRWRNTFLSVENFSRISRVGALSSGSSISFSFVRMGPVSAPPAGAPVTAFAIAFPCASAFSNVPRGLGLRSAPQPVANHAGAPARLDLLARHAAPVSVVLIDVPPERRAVACVREDRRHRLAVFRRDADDRDLRIHQPLRVVLDRPRAVLVVEAAIHPERGAR